MLWLIANMCDNIAEYKWGCRVDDFCVDKFLALFWKRNDGHTYEWNQLVWHPLHSRLHYEAKAKSVKLGWFWKQKTNCTLLVELQGGAGKSLARTTFQCRRTESIVSLERGVCSCAKLQVFSCYKGCKETCQGTCAISTTSRRKLSSRSPPPKGKAPKEIQAILIETLAEHAPSYANRQKLGDPF